MATMVDITAMLGNLSQSLNSVQYLVTGLSYLIGLACIFIGIMKIKNATMAGPQSQEPAHTGYAFFIGGLMLLFLPTLIRVSSNSVFGSSNILSYSDYNPNNIYQSLGYLLQTCGLIWFVRGCIILINASKPGNRDVKKGIMYVFAGTLALNFLLTSSAVNYLIQQFVSMSFVAKVSSTLQP